MKALPGNPTQNNWENTILKDLTFIKQRGRYPVSKRTLAPTLIIGLFFLAIARFAWVFFIVKDNNFFVYFISAMALLTIVASVLRYIRTIRFMSIITPFFVAENRALLKKFMQAEHLAFFQHPEAPEVFQILSKNISATNEQREVMVFIADDKRILVNSHFTGQKFTLTPPSKHYRQMAKMLEDWIKKQPVNGDNAIVPINS